MKWYDYVFGGRKAYQAVFAAGCGVMAWFTIPQLNRPDHLLMFLGYWAACFGIYGFYNLREWQIKNGGGK